MASGSFINSRDVQEVIFKPTSGRYVRLRALSEINGHNQINIAELTFLQAASAPNTVPSAVAQTLSTAEDTPLDIVLGGTDNEGAALSFSIVTAPANGTLSGIAPNLSYSPSADFNGTDSFTFVVNDGMVTSVSALVSITVAPVADNGISDWLAGFGLSGNPGNDPDHDSISNAVEYVIGGNPLNHSDVNQLPTISMVGGAQNSSLLFSYRHTQLAKADPSVSVSVEWSDNLTGPWTMVTEASGELIIEVPNGAGNGIDIVNVYIPCPSSGRLFARLGVAIAAP